MASAIHSANNKDSPILLIDGKNRCYAHYYAHKNMRNRAGEPTGLYYGVLREMLWYHKRVPESPQIFCWDGVAPTWRHKLNPSYKAQRKQTPDIEDMHRQIPVLLGLLGKLRFHVVRVDGVEADDVIGILAKRFSDRGRDVRICSGDRDMYQLVGDKVKVWVKKKAADGKREVLLVDLKFVKDWLGADPSAIIDIRAMAGDGADNLKGFPGIGPVKAVKLYQSGIRPSNPKARGLLGADLLPHWKRVQEEYKLAKIVTDELDDVWTNDQKERLSRAVFKVVEHPDRQFEVTPEMVEAFYGFLGRYELEEIFQHRTTFWKMA